MNVDNGGSSEDQLTLSDVYRQIDTLLALHSQSGSDGSFYDTMRIFFDHLISEQLPVVAKDLRLIQNLYEKTAKALIKADPKGPTIVKDKLDLKIILNSPAALVEKWTELAKHESDPVNLATFYDHMKKQFVGIQEIIDIPVIASELRYIARIYKLCADAAIDSLRNYGLE